MVNSIRSTSSSESDESDDDPDSDFSRLIYPSASVTVLGAYCAIMELKRACRLPWSAIVMVLQLLQLLCPAGNLLPRTKHKLSTFSRRYMSEHFRQNYCQTCMSELQGNQKCSSNECPSGEPNSLIYIKPDDPLKRTISGKDQ